MTKFHCNACCTTSGFFLHSLFRNRNPAVTIMKKEGCADILIFKKHILEYLKWGHHFKIVLKEHAESVNNTTLHPRTDIPEQSLTEIGRN